MTSGFTIQSPGSESLPNHQCHGIEIPASTEKHTWTILLRQDDKVCFSEGKLKFALTLKVEDDVKVDSSIPQTADEDAEDEVPETQEKEGPHPSTRRTRPDNVKPPKERTRVQVERSMQASSALRSTTPVRTTQSGSQMQVVAETPAINRKLPPIPLMEDSVPYDMADPKDLVSTDVSTPSAIKDSFAERSVDAPKPRAKMPSLELGSAATTASEVESEVEVANENENENTNANADDGRNEGRVEDDNENTMPSTTPEEDNGVTDGTPMAASFTSASDGGAVQHTGDMEMEDANSSANHSTTPRPSADPSSNAGEDIDLGEDTETPKVNPKRELRARLQPEVRIPAPRGKKRASPEKSPQASRPSKKSRKGKEQDESQDSLASSIRVRIDRTPASTIPLPAKRSTADISEKSTPAATQTSSQSSRKPIKASSEATYRGKAPRVAFSNTKTIERDTPLKFLKRQGVQIVDKVTEKGCDVVCIGSASGALVKSAKLLLGLAFGKPIVSDNWLNKSVQTGKLLDTSSFPPLNAPKEWEWGDNEEDVSETLDIDRAELFKNRTFFITPALKKEYGSGYGDVEKILKAAGAKVTSKAAREYKHTENTIILASEHGDLEAMTLSGTDKDEERRQCYTKDLISMSVLRGFLDIENEEFKIRLSGREKKGKGQAGGRKRKSGS
ncbi:BRCT domain-containing protein [Neofusicoccum parvum]|uniref:BRCT domain-containing protein n=1 Tax=Neofusicoccum parvum TaxID=310453 RepID=A0ACB5SAE4_9PEZI|nr:BRCT domain-containing protein [Neofusicoccum parvum]